MNLLRKPFRRRKGRFSYLLAVMIMQLLCEFAASVWERGKSGGSRSVELSEEQADAHIDIAIDFRLASGGGH